MAASGLVCAARPHTCVLYLGLGNIVHPAYDRVSMGLLAGMPHVRCQEVVLPFYRRVWTLSEMLKRVMDSLPFTRKVVSTANAAA